MAYEYIGKGTTDNSGVAHLTEDANGNVVTGYESQGDGDIKIVASTDSTITEQSLLSNIIELKDYLFWDNAVDGNHRSDWDNSSGTIGESYDENGTTITTADTNTSKNYMANYTMTDECVVEFDLVKHMSGNLRILCKGYDFYVSNPRLPVETKAHLKAILTNGNITWYINDNNIITTTTTQSGTFHFKIFGDGITFKNLKIYNY